MPRGSALATRHFLVVPVGAGARQPVTDAVVRAGGRVILAARSGALVVRMDESLKQEIGSRHDVRHLGDVDFVPRAIRRIRVDQSGNRIGP
jgi:hypothetical protein